MTKSKTKSPAKKIPKTVAGVKVPKSIRKQAGKAIEYAESGAVREVVGAALVAAATALATNKDARNAVKLKVRELGEGLQGAGKSASSVAADFTRDPVASAESFKAFAIGAARQLLDAWENPGGGGASSGSAKGSGSTGKSGSKGSKQS